MTIPPDGRSYVRRNARDTARGALARDGGVESEAHGANANDPVRLERMEMMDDLCSRLKPYLWRYTGMSLQNPSCISSGASASSGSTRRAVNGTRPQRSRAMS